MGQERQTEDTTGRRNNRIESRKTVEEAGTRDREFKKTEIMSTNVSGTEQNSTTKTKSKTDNGKRDTFTRSQSIEKIMKFNAYICSQNYYILPALLAWLKTSQTVLHSNAERCIFFAKSLVYNTIVYKAMELAANHLRAHFKEVSFKDPHQVSKAAATLATRIYRSTTTVSAQSKDKILRSTVYAAFFLIFFQLSACVFTLCFAAIPGGLIFLLAGITWISYLNYQCLRFVVLQQQLKEDEHKCDTTVTQKYIRPKDILGKRTISNLNLF